MAFSKVVLLVVFAVLVISAEVLAHRDLAETETAPTTDQEGRGAFNRGVIGGNTGGSVSCNRRSMVPCERSGGGKRVPPEACKKNPTRRECYNYGGGNGGKGGKGGKGGRGGHGPETEN